MPSGILLLDKPGGLSSNAALQRVRTLFGREKAGHVGSLDPLATGMLPVCLGEATKVAGEIVARRKCYRFTVALGARTASGDAEGAVIERCPVPPLECAQVASVLERFVGSGTQVPPMYSALKREGQPLYRLARAGVTVERAVRTIEIGRLRLLALGQCSLDLEVLCSKGTYVRVLAEDIAMALGSCGHVSALRREYVEPFEHEPMQTLESLADLGADARAALLLPVDAPLGHLGAVHLEPDAVRRVSHGQAVAVAGVPRDSRVRLYDGVRFLGIAQTDADGAVHPRRLLSLPGTAATGAS